MALCICGKDWVCRIWLIETRVWSMSSRNGRLCTVPDLSNAGLEKAVNDFRDIANDCYGRKGKTESNMP